MQRKNILKALALSCHSLFNNTGKKVQYRLTCHKTGPFQQIGQKIDFIGQREQSVAVLCWSQVNNGTTLNTAILAPDQKFDVSNNARQS